MCESKLASVPQRPARGEAGLPSPYRESPRRRGACRGISERGDSTAAKSLSRSPVCSCGNNGLRASFPGSSMLGPQQSPSPGTKGPDAVIISLNKELRQAGSQEKMALCPSFF